jgi:hypothetical protein
VAPRLGPPLPAVAFTMANRCETHKGAAKTAAA